ncbi:hypothetical protein AB5J52_06025 [Streptomyces sp. R39]|uniref:Uncharacterized protein n=1 Tax=Streptomyces sp. R39 TaxID=3238631 RepID=A0AB39QHW8_9ACTN
MLTAQISLGKDRRQDPVGVGDLLAEDATTGSRAAIISAPAMPALSKRGLTGHDDPIDQCPGGSRLSSSRRRWQR